MARGRPAAVPPPMSFADWKTLGCPSLLLTVAHVAEWCNLSVMSVNNYCKDGRLYRYPDGPHKSKVPTDDPKNREWLLSKFGNQRVVFHSPGRPTPHKPAATPAARAASAIDAAFEKAIASTSAAPTPPRAPAPSLGEGEDMLDLTEVLDALHTLDFSKLSAAAVQKVARIETALKTRADREAKRGLLIERTLVSTVFARLYQIDSNQLRTIGAKVAPDVAAELGVEDSETVLKIESRIDDEVLKVLSHIKRLMDDFLTELGGEPVSCQ